MDSITLTETLRGVSPWKIQTVGLMQVIPLVSDHSDERFAPLNRLTVSTTNYGSMVFQNPTNKPALIPKDAAYVTKQRTQDHALPHVGLVKGGGTIKYSDAACIQSSQGGMMRPDQHELIILPFLIRETALQCRGVKEYSKLWQTISRFNRAMGLRDTGHVDIFLEQFGEQLARFVAEFEPVPKQVGAIILINGKLAGVERVPSYDYWLQLWPTLIRECYGSLALYAQKQAETPRPLATRQRLAACDTIEELLAAVIQAETAEEEATRQIVRDLLDEPVNVEQESETLGGLQVETLTSRHFVGQCVRDGLQVIYASMVATEQRLAVAPEAVTAFSI